jgi:hypothetical protein
MIRSCHVCALVLRPTWTACLGCGEPMEPDMIAPPAANRVSQASGGPALLVALVAIVLAMMGLRRCEVEPLDDEHAAPAWVYLVKLPSEPATIEPVDGCWYGGEKLDRGTAEGLPQS